MKTTIGEPENSCICLEHSSAWQAPGAKRQIIFFPLFIKSLYLVVFNHMHFLANKLADVDYKVCILGTHLNWKRSWNRWDSLWPKNDTASQYCKIHAFFRNKLLCCHLWFPINIHWNSFVYFLVEGLHPFINCLETYIIYILKTKLCVKAR